MLGGYGMNESRKSLLKNLYNFIEEWQKADPPFPDRADPERLEKITALSKRDGELDAAFWEKVREIYPADLIPDALFSRLRSHAWEVGHSSGYSEVLNEVVDLAYLVLGPT